MDWSLGKRQVREVLFSACEVDRKKWVAGAPVGLVWGPCRRPVFLPGLPETKKGLRPWGWGRRSRRTGQFHCLPFTHILALSALNCICIRN